MKFHISRPFCQNIQTRGAAFSPVLRTHAFAMKSGISAVHGFTIIVMQMDASAASVHAMCRKKQRQSDSQDFEKSPSGQYIPFVSVTCPNRLSASAELCQPQVAHFENGPWHISSHRLNAAFQKWRMTSLQWVN
jgi:hypothetical protein